MFKSKRVDILLIISTSVTLTTLFISYVLPWVNNKLQILSSIELITISGVIVTGIAGTLPIIFLRIKSSSKARIDLKVQTYRMSVIVTCTIKNIGTRRITPKNVYLFLDEGIEQGTFVKFPFLLKHEDDQNDCVLAKICKKGELEYPSKIIPKEFDNIYTDYRPLEHLSSQSILFIDPDEQFSEDAIIRLPHEGVFRVICIFTAKDCECLCASRQFIINDSYPVEIENKQEQL